MMIPLLLWMDFRVSISFLPYPKPLVAITSHWRAALTADMSSLPSTTITSLIIAFTDPFFGFRRTCKHYHLLPGLPLQRSLPFPGQSSLPHTLHTWARFSFPCRVPG